jgi:hypothetical protein
MRAKKSTASVGNNKKELYRYLNRSSLGHGLGKLVD